MSEATAESPDLVHELDVPARFEIAREWALAAKQVAETTQDQEALKIWNFIRARTALGVAMPEGGVHYFFTQKPERPVEEYALLTPVTEADIERLPEHDFRRQLAEGKHNIAAQYREGSHAIYLPPPRFGTLGKGILLQHEAMHAWLDLEKHVDREVNDSHWFEEAEVFTFEFSLVAKLIGDPYDDLVSKVGETISAHESNSNARASTYLFTEEDRNMIATHLGVLNDHEIDFWHNTVVNFNAFWKYFQEQFEDPNTEFAQFLKAMYTHQPPSSDLLPD